MRYHCDHLIIGGGMAGTSIAAELAQTDSVVLLERESQLGYHTTGRSAAIFLETYGSRIFRLFTHFSRDFFYSTLDSETPLISERGAMFVAAQPELEKLKVLYEEVRSLTDSVQWLTSSELTEAYSCLSDHWAAGVLEPNAMDIDVHNYHQLCIRKIRRLKGEIHTNSEVTSIKKNGNGWLVKTKGDVYCCENIINAAGAWADKVAQLAGQEALQLKPLKRSAILIEVEHNLSEIPYIGDINESFYFKPGADGVMVSPCDEFLEEPNDTAANEMDVAIAIDRFEKATNQSVKKLKSKWAGLRTFSPDRNPVIGFDGGDSSFFWLAGQGGYGIQTAPAIAELASALIRDDSLPSFMLNSNISMHDISPARFRQ